MASLSYNKETEIIQAFNSTSRYLDDLLNIDNPYFGGMVGRIYPPELQQLFYDTLSKNKNLTFFLIHLKTSPCFLCLCICSATAVILPPVHWPR